MPSSSTRSISIGLPAISRHQRHRVGQGPQLRPGHVVGLVGVALLGQHADRRRHAIVAADDRHAAVAGVLRLVARLAAPGSPSRWPPPRNKGCRAGTSTRGRRPRSSARWRCGRSLRPTDCPASAPRAARCRRHASRRCALAASTAAVCCSTRLPTRTVEISSIRSPPSIAAASVAGSSKSARRTCAPASARSARLSGVRERNTRSSAGTCSSSIFAAALPNWPDAPVTMILPNGESSPSWRQS